MDNIDKKYDHFVYHLYVVLSACSYFATEAIDRLAIAQQKTIRNDTYNVPGRPTAPVAKYEQALREARA